MPTLFDLATPTLRPLRARQINAIDAIRAEIKAGHKRIICQAPTGFGKTLLSAHIIQSALSRGKRPMFTCPAINLVNQTLKAFEAEGIRDIGIIQAQHERTDWTQPVQIASVQTLIRRALPEVDFVIIDEAHNVWDALNAILDGDAWKGKIVIGLTATPWTKGMGLRWTSLVVAARTSDLIAEGFLTPFRIFAPAEDADLSKVRTTAGDYNEADLSEAMDKPKLVADIVETWLKLGDNLPTFLFAVDRKHAKSLRDEFETKGISCGYIDAFSNDDERKETFRRFRSGEDKIIASVGCLIQGIDEDVRVIIDAAPTKSEIRHCLDTHTEILTSHGWKHWDEVRIGDCVASTDNIETLHGCWSTVTEVITRPMSPEERWIKYDAPRSSFRVTDNHRMIAAPRVKATKHHAPWRFSLANEATKTGGMFFPTAVHMNQVGVPLTSAELYFIGMMMTDGTWNKNVGSISQSERYPEVIERIEKCLSDCDIAYSKRRFIDKKANYVERFSRWVYTISVSGRPARKGVGKFKTKYTDVPGGRGFRYLLPFMDKDVSPALMQISKPQLSVLLQGLWDGDGIKMKNVDWTPQSLTICSARKLMLDRLQALCAINGMTASIGVEAMQNGGGRLWRIAVTPKDWRHCGGYPGRTNEGRPIIESVPATHELVWCVETNAGTIVTRRRDKVTVMGNCQKIGRGLRTAPGKSHLTILDHAGNTLRLGMVTDIHHEHLDTRKKGEKGSMADDQPAPKPKKCKECGALMPRGAKACPQCGVAQMEISGVLVERGELVEFGSGKKKPLIEVSKAEKQLWYSGFLHMAMERGRKPGWGAYRYREKFGVWPRGLEHVAYPPTLEMKRFDEHCRIKYAKGRH